jgi:hypothetical protein
MDKPVILYDSPEAATWKEGIAGWVSSDGHFYGKDGEHMARWAGSTHQLCETCGEQYETRSWCRPCHAKKRNEKFLSFPVEKWDGETPLCLFDSDTYFFNEDILDFLADEPDTELQICKCSPIHLHLLDDDIWCDELPEDGEVPEEVSKALDALNEAIKKAGPVAWTETNVAIDLDDLRSRVNR